MVDANPSIHLTDDIASEVIHAAQSGDEAAFAAIHAHYGNRLYTLIVRLVTRRALADDLFQEVFLEVFRSIGGFMHAGSFGGWLRAIAINKSMSYLRSPWHRSVLWLDATLPADAEALLEREMLERNAGEFADAQNSSIDAHRQMSVALRQLSPLTRAVVWLHDVEGYTHGEIGKLLGRTTSFSKSQLSRAHVRLRELLDPELPAPKSEPPHKSESLSCTAIINSVSN